MRRRAVLSAPARFARTILFALSLAAACPVLPTAPAAAGPGDEALLPHLSRAELVLRGKILSFPRGRAREDAPTRYRVDFLVYDVLKGNDDVERRILRVDIERYEETPRDSGVVAGRKAILLVRKLDPASRVFTTVDPWFGMLADNAMMARTIRELSGKGPGTAEVEITDR